MQFREGIAAALTLVALSARPAAAQASFSIDQLPASTGRVAQYSLTPRGDVDGLILDDGTEIHFPPPLGPALIDTVKPGDTVLIHGLHARVIPMIQAAAITNQATGRTVTDRPGAPAPNEPVPVPLPVPVPTGGAPHPMAVSGTIKSQLHGPRGDLNGVLLTDGTIIRLPPADAAQHGDELQPGATFAAEGRGIAGPLGRIVAADRIGNTPETLSPVAAGPPPPAATTAIEMNDMTTASMTWLHIGDLHLKSKDAPNLRDLQQIVACAAALPPGALDFVLLPGDNADDGTPAQYRLVRSALSPLRLPLHVLPGDHDVAAGDLGAFYDTLGAPRLPYATTIRNCRCLFLDVVSAGTGGPDFRLGPDQLDWAEREVAQAAADARSVAIFMHTYPADLREGADRIGALLGQSHVACVDMGHTHYNELANDGSTIFMATRSTGQIEEGPPGFSIAALDAGCVSWRFKPLDAPWPFVLITAPADLRLTTALSRDADPARICATILGDRPIVDVTLEADGAPPQPMHPVPDRPGTWQTTLSGRPNTIRVQARDEAGRTDRDQIDLPPPDFTLPETAADGSDKDRIGAWPARGIVGGQLGPNRNGRKW